MFRRTAAQLIYLPIIPIYYGNLLIGKIYPHFSLYCLPLNMLCSILYIYSFIS